MSRGIGLPTFTPAPDRYVAEDQNVFRTTVLEGFRTVLRHMNVIEVPPVYTFTAADATPSVRGGKVFKTAGTTAITDFDDGQLGQEITILATDSITITHGASTIVLNAAGNFAMANGDTLTLRMFTAGVWHEVSRSDNT